MKTIVIGIMALGVVGAVIHFVPSTSEVIKVPEVDTKEVVKEVVPDWADNEEAVQAAKDVIRRQELEAQQAQLVEEISARQEQLDAVRAELESY